MNEKCNRRNILERTDRRRMPFRLSPANERVCAQHSAIGMRAVSATGSVNYTIGQLEGTATATKPPFPPCYVSGCVSQLHFLANHVLLQLGMFCCFVATQRFQSCFTCHSQKKRNIPRMFPGFFLRPEARVWFWHEAPEIFWEMPLHGPVWVVKRSLNAPLASCFNGMLCLRRGANCTMSQSNVER